MTGDLKGFCASKMDLILAYSEIVEITIDEFILD